LVKACGYHSGTGLNTVSKEGALIYDKVHGMPAHTSYNQILK